jgi:divalent metal cation (Fe/Co/Zn/Cd) transporter
VDERQILAARGRRLEYVTILWNSLEGVLALVAGALAGSVSLMGFGVDSFIEVTSGAAVLWRMSSDHDAEAWERRERLALRIVGIAFLALAAYVIVEAIRDLAARAAPDASPLGIAVACASLVAMPLLARAKRTVGDAMGSRAMHADAAQTDFCAYLSGILLVGLALNAAFGLWWADPVAGLVMVPIIANEGIKALRGDPCHCD